MKVFIVNMNRQDGQSSKVENNVCQARQLNSYWLLYVNNITAIININGEAEQCIKNL